MRGFIFFLTGLASASFAVAASRTNAPDYRVILWCGKNLAAEPVDSQALATACHELGVTTLMTGPEDDPSKWMAAGFDTYVENIVNTGLCLKYRSSVTDWNAMITAWCPKRDHAKFVRDYGFADPVWRKQARETMTRAARQHAPFHPVFYDIRDELSVTFSANPFDYDFSPTSLTAFRAWLQKRYSNLAALNAAWQTAFPAWKTVTPYTTDEIKARMAGQTDAQGRRPDWSAVRAMRYTPDAVNRNPDRWHLAPWCDFRSFMDDGLAETLADLRDAAHAVDPDTPVGIEGTQMPSAWGGYDLWKLSRVLDWVEPYDITAARAVWGSFMRGKPLLATYGERDPAAVSRRLWHRLLEGDCGAILWWSEDLLEGSGGQLRLSAKGRALAPVVCDMHTPLARLFLHAERLYDPVAIHYSQTSIQLAWLFESFEDGATWPRRFSSYEATHNRHAALRTEVWQRLREAGWSPQFVSYDELAQGALTQRGLTACLLPDSYALSDAEVSALKRFAAQPSNRLLYIGQPGVFTANGTPRTDVPFSASTQTVTELVARLPPPPVRVTTPNSGVCVYRYRLNGTLLFALEQRQTGQTGEDVTKCADGPSAALHVTFAYNDPRPLFDLRNEKQVGTAGRAEVDVPADRPALLGFSPLLKR